MPFTISHAVLAPIISKLSRDKLPISALAIGCMVPDLVRLFSSDENNDTHFWSSIIYPNLLIGLFFYFIWLCIYRHAVFRFLGVNKPIRFKNTMQLFQFSCFVIFAILIGTATHLIWDGLTHDDFRTFIFRDVLILPVHLFGQVYPLHRILQIGTSIAVLPILTWMLFKFYFKYRQTIKVSQFIRRYAYSLLLISILAGILGYGLFSAPFGFLPNAQLDLYWYVGQSINYFFRFFLITFALGCLIFQYLDHRYDLSD